MISAIAIPDNFLPGGAARKALVRCQIAIGELLGWGYWYWDMATDTLVWSSKMESIYGLPHNPKGFSAGTYADLYLANLWDEDSAAYTDYNVQQAMDERIKFKLTFRVRRKSDAEKAIVIGVGWWLYDAEGCPIAMYGWNKHRRLLGTKLELVDASLNVVEKTHAVQSKTHRSPSPESMLVAAISFAQCLNNGR